MWGGEEIFFHIALCLVMEKRNGKKKLKFGFICCLIARKRGAQLIHRSNCSSLFSVDYFVLSRKQIKDKLYDQSFLAVSINVPCCSHIASGLYGLWYQIS